MYGTVEAVAAAFDAQQWDPSSDAPLTATVTTWLTTESSVLDGQIAHIVSTPVDPTDCPQLAAVCDQIVVLKAQARVKRFQLPDEAGQKQATDWIAEADRLIKGIQGGATADGAALGRRSPDAPGAAAYNFSDDDGGESNFRMGQVC